MSLAEIHREIRNAAIYFIFKGKDNGISGDVKKLIREGERFVKEEKIPYGDIFLNNLYVSTIFSINSSLEKIQSEISKEYKSKVDEFFNGV